ncbi:cytochrome-c peroxidase [Aliterella atlantica]|uniref:Cytochrome B6 n=1 Tax=Aliterella atlantica CENA595 TaxID=1618023 RepID=A0A0D8ZTV0_9CYAN|nr:cytochrome c peroxidase [Aliterella atlantica]KJH71894.1 cytochrome B6 [Aliterella atlantica CENA595]
MDLFSPSLHVKRRIYLIVLVVLACLVALVWQQFQTSQPLTRPKVEQVEVKWANEPIQPIPLTIDLDRDQVALGKQLFEDVRLSKNNQISCLSCHSYSTGGTDRAMHETGGEKFGAINTLSVFNSSFNFRLNWSGKFEQLAQQIDSLLQNPKVMGSNWQDIIVKLRSSSQYRQAFARIYPDGLTPFNVKDAIATFEQSLYTPNSRFDQFLRGNAQALTAAEKEGYRIFKDYGCVSCHQGINVGGNMFQRFGVMGDYLANRGHVTKADLGRFNVTHNPADRYVFRVPSLRNVALTPPYFHDGSAQNLEQAIAVMAKYQLGRPLSKQQTDLITQFLGTLTGEYQGKPL